MVDMQGRLIGKRFQAEFFLDVRACGDATAATICSPMTSTWSRWPGYAAASWDKGYGDFVMQPDMTTLAALARGSTGTALVLADVLDHHHHDIPQFAARDAQTPSRAAEAAENARLLRSELEFYLFDESYETIHNKHYIKPKTAAITSRIITSCRPPRRRA